VATAAEISYLRGRWDDALVNLAGVDAMFISNASNLNVAALGALVALHRDERDRADGYLRAAGVDEPRATAALRTPANWRLTAARALRAEVAGDLGRALKLMAALLDPPPLPGQQTRQEVLPHLVRLALAAADRTVATAAVAAAEADADADPLAGRATAARCCRAQLGDDINGLMACADEYRECGWPLQRAGALEEAAVRLAAAGDSARARTAFTDALKTYFDLGAAWDLRRVQARLRPYGIRRGPRTLRHRATSGWGSLTAAEARIAQLVASGMSNPDIASELFLSRRTVQTHVSNILTKLQLRSRVDVVREFAAGQAAPAAGGTFR
jgi:DNA-binding CsgD family transcriptional regulator